MTDEAADGRTAAGEVEIDASPERVWRALTEAAELERWFPLDAKVEAPGPGGRMWMSWGGDHGSWSRIEAWDPPRHLRITWQWGDGPAQVTDSWLEPTEGGGTRLRVVTSGFPAGADWDDLVEGTRLGWRFELRQLRHYLERHDGEERGVAHVQRRVSIPRPEAWERLTSGLDLDGLSDEPIDHSPPWQWAGVTRDPADGLMRLTVDPTHTDADLRDVTIFLCAWGEAGSAVAAAAEAWRAELARLFPEGTPMEAAG